ncbi:hypothetical protein FRB99_007945 [Tulasnella sp. 403]|nr:hypothetical protein FRB99_007945 [Tulasnella sp. 403]
MAGTWNVYVVATFVSIAGLFFGLDTGAIGPVTVMPQFLDKFGKFRNEAIQGALVATILFSASTASFFSGALSDRISRRRTIMLGALVAGIGSALEAGSNKLGMLVVGRLVAGAGEGIFLGPCGVYLIEISPPKVRGQITTILQLFITIGICSGYFICYGSVKIASSFSWRLPFIIQTCVAFTLAAGMERLPYSPRWLLQVGRTEEAWQVMEMLDRHSAEQEKAEILARQNAGTYDATLKETFREGTTRWRTLLGIFLMGMQQLSGIDAVLYFAPLVFRQAGLDSQEASFLASGISGIVLVVVTIPAQLFLMDRWGRRPASIWGGLTMGICMLVIGSLYASGGAKSTAGKWTIIALIYVFVVAFSVTWAITLKLFIIEVQPNRTRAIASSLSHSSNWIVNMCVALTTPLFLSKSASGPYFLFAACLLLTTVVCILYVPETLGKSLTEVDEVWNERTSKTHDLFARLGHKRRFEDREAPIELLTVNSDEIRRQGSIA